MLNLTIQLDDQTFQELRRKAAEQKESLEQIIRSALRAYTRDPTDSEAGSVAVEARHARIREEAAAWRSLPAMERERYGTDFVAVLHGRVLDHDSNRATLVQRVHVQVGDTPVLITPAGAEAPREFQHIGLRRFVT